MARKVAVIGGGIIGATAAFYLSFLDSNHQLAITLFDDGTGQATKAASGIISPWLSKRRNKRWYALAKDGAAFYSKLVADAQLGLDAYQQTGTIVTRRAKDALEALYQEAQIKVAHTPAMQAVQMLSSKEVGQRLPFLTNRRRVYSLRGAPKLTGLCLLTICCLEPSKMG